MITIQRLNMDSSWLCTIDGKTFVVDPWLVGSEIDGFNWLNEQWHVHEPVPPEQIPEYDFIVITQSYEDHCHIDTLRMLDATKPILATDKAFKRLKRKFPDREIHHISDKNSEFEFMDIRFLPLRPKKLVDPIYFSLFFGSKGHGGIFYAPHGFTLSEGQLGKLSEYRVKLLITTFTDFRLPEILGGHVNPGEENAAKLCMQLKPELVVHTHDEQKKMKGLVAKYARVKYPDYARLAEHPDYNFIEIGDYSAVLLGEQHESSQST